MPSKTRRSTRADQKRDRLLADIAKRILNVPTLVERRSDSLDFHEVGVWQIQEALKAAYEAGQNDVK